MSEPGKKTISIRLPDDLHAKAQAVARGQGRSFNNWINQVLEHLLTGASSDGTPLVPPGQSEAAPFRLLECDGEIREVDAATGRLAPRVVAPRFKKGTKP
jgi:hypothetical protein